MRATQAGIDLIGMVKEELLKSAKLTGIWEGRLRDIERGSYSAAGIYRPSEGNDQRHCPFGHERYFCQNDRVLSSDSSINTIKRKSVIEENPPKK